MTGAGGPVTPPGGAAARYVGSAVHRKEDARLLTGHGLYVDDVALPGMLHAAFLRSELAKASITGLDVREARAAPGVVAVFTASDFAGRFNETGQSVFLEQVKVPAPLAGTDVRHVGDPVALVVAESRHLAEDACELIQLDLEPAEPSVDYVAAAADPDRLVHARSGLETNVMAATPFTSLPDDLEATFEGSDRTIEVTVVQHRYLAAPMETRGIVASWVPGRDELDVVCASQSVHETRNFLSRYLGVPEGAIRVSARDVGGGFGQKMFIFREECAVVLASRLLGRPVKWIEDRRENLLAGSHSRNETGTVRLAVDRDLTISAIAVDHFADVGAYPISPSVMDTKLLPGPYRIPKMGFSSTLAWTNTMGKGAYRGPWLFETTAREMAIDHAARELGVDPVELRRRNLLTAADLPYTSPSGYVFEDATPLETLERALEVLGFEAFRAEQAEARREGRLLGLGTCVYVEPSAKGLPTLSTDAATVRVEQSGKVVAFLGTSSHGQSIETTMAQVVADSLGVAYDDVTVVQGQTESTPYGPGTGGSRTAVVGGGAVRRAAEAVRDKVVAVAAHKLEADASDVTVEAGRAFVRGTPARALTMKEVAAAAYTFAHLLPPDIDAGLEATARFRPAKFPTWSNAAHLCVVEVDPATCVPTVRRYIVCEDCGEMINPAVVDGQVSGGVVQGIGGVLLENFVYDDAGNPLTTTLMDYLLPTAADVPVLEIVHMGGPAGTNPGGFKGMGEGGAIGSHAAVANAVGDALAHLGARVTRTPLGPNEIFDLIEAARATG